MNYPKHISAAFIVLPFFGGCASAEGTKPHDMSTAKHEAAGAEQQTASAQHASQYAPGASVTTEDCGDNGGCWTSERNPTAQHKTDAREHEQLAEQHRTAAHTLRDAENAACTQLSEQDRVTSPFYHREDISSVGKAERLVSDGLGSHSEFAGGRAVFRAMPGMTTEWMQRLVNCHLARAASVGFVMPEMNYCPLMLKDVSAQVSSAGDGFAITVTSTSPETAAEISRRILALK